MTYTDRTTEVLEALKKEGFEGRIGKDDSFKKDLGDIFDTSPDSNTVEYAFDWESDVVDYNAGPKSVTYTCFFNSTVLGTVIDDFERENVLADILAKFA